MISSPGTPTGANLSSVLAADIGVARTRLALFTCADDGRWTVRGVTEAVSTAQSPREGMMGGIATAARELEQRTGLALLGRRNTLLAGGASSNGPGALIVSGSAAAPLRVVTLASTAEHSGLWTDVAAAWSYIQVIDRAVRDAGLQDGVSLRWADPQHYQGWPDVQARIRLMAPDAVLLTGGYDGGDVTALLKTARDLLAIHPDSGAPLTVVFAGNRNAEAHLRRMYEARADLRVAANVLPTARQPHVQSAGETLDELYCQRKLAALTGFGAVASQCAAPVLSSARALALAWTSLSSLFGEPVLGFDLGASSTVAGLVLPDDGYHLSVASDLGANNGWDSSVRDTDSHTIGRWIPIPFSKTEIQTRLANRQSLYSAPKTSDAFYFQEAVAREAWRSIYPFATSATSLPEPSATPVNIVGSGGIVAHTPSLWRVALMLLDAAEPLGVVRLWADRNSVLPQLGALAAINGDAAQSLLQGGALTQLGLAVCLDGATTPGGKAADIEMKLADGTVRRTIAAWGTLHLLHTAGLGPLELTLRPVRGVYVPGHDDSTAFTTTIEDGSLGVIIDCRGRPLADQLQPEHSYARMRAWMGAGEA